MAKIRLGAVVALAVGMGVAAGGAFAHEHMGAMPKTPMGKAAYARHQNFKAQGAAFKAILDEIKKDSPDKAVIATNSAKLKGLAGQLPTWFPKGSGAESGMKTDAKPEVWSDPAGFAAAANRLQVESSKLDQLARAGDIAGVKGEVRAVGGACKNCHDKYRVPEQH
ncbi:c-type cytochrome [Phenylobacterium soli]|uniref:Cytochrome c n=1 Tax=Phenylobacterium soli TaxID=2170551 RepID=A0A328AND5_9CAUL|nr:cytochrome c [Phenylobacterium soli]RAK55845.1 cytochrome c [Phenylobacterium soli]